MSHDWVTVIPDLAHDVRALVRKGLLNTQLLDRELESTASEEIKARLAAIIESQTDLNRLLTRVVALAEAERGPSTENEIELSTAASAVRLACLEALTEVGATVVWHEMPACLVPASTQTVLRELIDNARQFRDLERPLQIAVDGEIRGEKVRVRIADNGTGVAAADTVNLFRPLHRLSAHRSGFGLGLAICRAIVERRGGHIYNLPADPGAIFVFELALAHGG